jgi:putative transcription factor
MDHQDWKPLSWDKRGEKPTGQSNKTFLANEARKGNVSGVLKKGSLNQNKVNVVTNARKLDSEEDTFKHRTIGLDTGKKISQARCEKKLTQKQLANALSLPESIIKDFESGKAIYNAMIMNKLEKFLEKRFRE